MSSEIFVKWRAVCESRRQEGRTEVYQKLIINITTFADF